MPKKWVFPLNEVKQAEASVGGKWEDDFRRLGVWTNADTPDEARCARTYGAEGIGLCRTEHMFFESRRLHDPAFKIQPNHRPQIQPVLSKSLKIIC